MQIRGQICFSSTMKIVNPFTHTESPLLIIAGPGAGKTYTLVERVLHLVRQNIQAENIMVATFTEKAAKELITRVSTKLLEEGFRVNLNEMYIGTLHSIFLRILEDHREFTRLQRNYRILDAFDQKYFVFRYMDEFLAVENSEELVGKATSAKWYKAGRVVGHLSTISEECLNADVLLKSDVPAIKAMGEFQKIYQAKLKAENCLDFSGIQTEILHLLENQPEILERLQDKLEYIMVDEYQDTNTIQERILLLLANKHKRIAVVGDDDQGLYRFRGATIRNILEFPDNFAEGECKQARLTTNYRSHPEIIDFYNRWMEECDWENNGKVFRYQKTITPREDEFVDNASVIKVSAGGSRENYFNEVYEFIKNLEDNGKITDYNQIAFLFQSVKNQNVQALAEFLESKDIKVFSPRSALFFEREEIRLLLGALIFIFPNLFDELKWSDNAKLEIWDIYSQKKKTPARIFLINSTIRKFSRRLTHSMPSSEKLKRKISIWTKRTNRRNYAAIVICVFIVIRELIRGWFVVSCSLFVV